ncbi:MAG TPA: aldo/keto reductase [Candidatus Hydrogenedentes bacterium]|jgi:methylglyoxal reductase|nr:aldo/keto reductase [Candidatus Hydrogenedentota bacterium]HPJ99657.1 aldo/keto reductase [Candidatus Hydrogenedentota bacterium]
MRYSELGKSGITASVIGMGTWVTGGGMIWGEDPDDAESIRAIHAALDTGITLIDTAPSYGRGRSEDVVGKAIRDRRDKVVLATKCGLLIDDDRGAFFTEFDGHRMYRSLRPETIRDEVEVSLRRMQTDRIDLYQTHWPAIEPLKTPIADTMACLMNLKAQGKIRAIGVSNVSLEELKENDAAGDLDGCQFRYSMLARQAESDILPYCLKHNVATLTYMSLEQGLLTGKIGMDRVFSKEEFRSDTGWNPWFAMSHRQRVLDLLAGWSDLTAKYRCTLAQLVLAWTLGQPGVTHVLAGARKTSQIEENVAAADLDIASEDLDRMRRDIVALGEPA